MKIKDIQAGRCTWRPCVPSVLLAQIGRGNVAAISGLRVGRLICQDDDGRPDYFGGVVLPVANGWAVHVGLAWDDTYTVRQVFRGKVRQEWTGVYCDVVGEVAYRASLWEEVTA